MSTTTISIQTDTEPEWSWTAPKQRAARLLAEDELTDEEIAQDVGITRPTLSRWKRNAAFAAKVTEHVTEIGAAERRYAIARATRRVAALDDRWRKLRQVAEERAADPAMQGVPGGATGLLVRTLKSIGTGVTQQVVEEYTLDAALLRELREHEKQAAQELGQWLEDAPGETSVNVTVVGGIDLTAVVGRSSGLHERNRLSDAR